MSSSSVRSVWDTNEIDESDCSLNQKSRLEDLSNEIFYEIIDFLDTFDAYDAFYGLNDRFRQFFRHFSLPYRINLSLTCRTPLQQRCRHIQPDVLNRIISLRFSSQVVVDHVLLSISFDGSFTSLQSLTLLEMKEQKLTLILISLSTIPRLASLTVTTTGILRDPATIHRLLFALPVLKYCNTKFQWEDGSSPFLNLHGTTSPIEYFVSKSVYDLKCLAPVLSCIPHLVHLSLGGSVQTSTIISWTPIILEHLTYLHLRHSISFHELEMFMSNFIHQLRVLRISSGSDLTSADVKRWQHLISAYLPRLQTFDLQHFGGMTDLTEYSLIRNEFNSSFWWKRKWFFTFQQFYFLDTAQVLVCSQNSSSGKSDARSVRGITIDALETIFDFPSSSLTLPLSSVLLTGTSFFEKVNQAISYEQLRRLTVIDTRVSIDQVMKLLNCSSGIQMLTLSVWTSSQLQYDRTIDQLVIEASLGRVDVQDVIDTFPQVKSLQIGVVEDDLEKIVRILFRHKIRQNSPLYLLRIRHAHSALLNRLHKVIDREQLYSLAYSIELLAGTAYLRW